MNESKYTVKEATTLLPFLLETLNGQSRTTVKSLLKNRQIIINGQRTTQHDTPLEAGDTVSVSRERASRAEFHNPMMKIVWMDDYIAVIYKEEGLLSVSGAPNQKHTAHNILSEYLQSLHPQNRLYVVHRLDKGTSGLMMFARQVEVQHTLRDNWHTIITNRSYIAVTEGRPPRDEGTIVTYLSENKRQKVYCTTPQQGKEAISHYRVIGGNEQYCILELSLETGRKNQIRAQMEHLGCPVAGDPKYGAKTNPCGRLMLHANSLCFTHPVSGEKLSFEYPAPVQFYEICKD